MKVGKGEKPKNKTKCGSKTRKEKMKSSRKSD